MLSKFLIPQNGSIEEMFKAISLFERQNLAVGSLDNKLTQNTKLWLLHQGQLLHSQGQILTPGNIYINPTQGKWEATQPTIAYSLPHTEWQTALQHWPQLAELTEFPQPQLTPPLPTRNIIPFRQPTREEAPRKKLRTYFPRPTINPRIWWQKLTKRYPFFEQQSASDCGAACLVMISRYWGKNLSVNRLRELANVSRSGASMRSLTAAAEAVGFATRPVKASLDKLAQQPLPAIAHWEGKHYIVVYEISKKRVIVADPAIGQRTLTLTQFKAGWTGYALLLQPTT